MGRKKEENMTNRFAVILEIVIVKKLINIFNIKNNNFLI